MAGLVFRTEKGTTELATSLLASLEPAVSNETRDITQRVHALRSRPSPAFLQIHVDPASKNKALDEQLFDALAEVKAMTSQVAMHLDKDWRDKLFHQLDSLHDPAEWERDDQPIQRSSFGTFLK